MKVLWLSMTSGLLRDTPNDSYGGGGWISSLENLVIGNPAIQLALAYISPSRAEKTVQDGVAYYPIYRKSPNPISKLITYYGGYKSQNNEELLPSIDKIIYDFNPDIIHLFGIENPMAVILGNTPIPVVVHLQGILCTCDNAYYPSGVSDSSFYWPPSIREWLLNNGYVYNKKLIHLRGIREKELLKKMRYCMGRTSWDYTISHLFAPEVQYYTVNEVLRQPFYDNCGSWMPLKRKLTIVSTISDVPYKGLDIILKTADLLKNEFSTDFEWKIVGISADAHIARMFESKLKINASSVNVKYLGVKQPDEIVRIMMDSSVYVHPSYIDNSPNSICEAQMLGMPVVACNVGGVSTLMDNGNAGFLVPANDIYDLAYRLRQYVNPDEKVEQMRIHGLQSARSRHNKQEIAGGLIHTYRMIINHVSNRFH